MTNGYVDSGPVVANTWYTIIAWHNAGNDTINIQVNNGTVNSQAYAGGATDTTQTLGIGARYNGLHGIDGRIDEVALYKSVLTAAERTWMYNDGYGRSYADANPPTTPLSQFSQYTYSAEKPHAVTEVSHGASGTDTYTYDANGNMTCRVEAGVTYIQAYNADNRLTKVQKLATGTCAQPLTFAAEWDFAYDGDGVRTISHRTEYVDGSPQPVETTFYYFGGAYEVTNGAMKKYYSFAGATVAMRDSEGLKFLLTDHLGSVVAMTDASGSLLSQQRYLPFGGVREDVGTITQTDFGYTSQRNLPDMGLMDYKARFYSPVMMRFMQPDTIVPDETNPQAWNRFAYVRNSPLNYTDPTGHREVEGCGVDGKANCILSDSEISDNVIRETDENEERCEAGEEVYCTYASQHPVETAVFFIAGFGSLGLLESGIYAVGAALEGFSWSVAGACIKSAICRSVTGMAGGKGAQIIYDASVGRYRDVATGRFIKPPFPSNYGFASGPTPTTLSRGTVVDRFGRIQGSYAGVPGDSISARGMAPGSEAMTYTVLRVVKEVTVPAGPAAPVPAFAATGGGIQYYFAGGIQSWIQQGLLEVIQ